MRIEEVHLWRGSVQQQALRSEFAKATQFAYFDAQLDHPDWRGQRVLDFGGNRGNLLRDPSCTIRHDDYYCLDVILAAIEAGRETFPDAHFVHYDRYNCSFNPDGSEDLPVPDLGIEFDFILAYSVFTHTTLAEMKDLVGQLRRLLAPEGRLAFTFIDPHWNGNLRWRLQQANPESQVDDLTLQSRDARWCSLVNGTELYLENSGKWDLPADQCMTYHVYYKEEFLRELFPGAIIKKPVNGEMQHCCILTADVMRVN